MTAQDHLLSPNPNLPNVITETPISIKPLPTALTTITNLNDQLRLSSLLLSEKPYSILAIRSLLHSHALYPCDTVAIMASHLF